MFFWLFWMYMLSWLLTVIEMCIHECKTNANACSFKLRLSNLIIFNLYVLLQRNVEPR